MVWVNVTPATVDADKLSQPKPKSRPKGKAAVMAATSLSSRTATRRTDVIRRCRDADFDTIYAIINDAASAYRGVIPAAVWHEPYMSAAELAGEIAAGVEFWAFQRGDDRVGVMGAQLVGDVTLIRHAYVYPARQGQGIGSSLLSELCSKTALPMLVGTWSDALWAIRFYEKHGFRLVSPILKDRLLRKYWSIPKRQIETSVVLADQKWFDLHEDSCPGFSPSWLA